MRKYIGLILCLSLFLTACGKDETTNSKSGTIGSTTSTNTEAIEDTISIVTTESETEAPTIEQISENSNEILQGVQWNDDIETIKSSMTEYICSFEESYVIDPGETKTYLSFLDVKLYGDTLDISFVLTNGKLTAISYTYIQSTTKTKTLEDWSVMFADTYGEHSSVESTGFYSLYTWDSIMDDSVMLEVSSFDGGVNIDLTCKEQETSNNNINNVYHAVNNIEFYSDIETVKKKMNGYTMQSESSKVSNGQIQNLLTYPDVSLYNQICDLSLCFTSKGLIGINYIMSCETGTEEQQFSEWLEKLILDYGEPTENKNGIASWDENPLGEKTMVYLFKFDSRIQISFFGDDSGSLTEFSEINEADMDENALSKIQEILYGTRMVSEYSDSIGTVLIELFGNYTVTYQKSNINENEYLVKFSGSYLPNPTVSQIVEKGAITYRINTFDGTCEIEKDDSNIYQTMIAYVTVF